MNMMDELRKMGAGFGVVFVGWERNIGLVTGMEVCGQKTNIVWSRARGMRCVYVRLG